MKKFIIIIAATLSINLGFKLAAQMPVNTPEGWANCDNWLASFQTSFSQASSASWLLEQMDDATQLLSSADNQGLILIKEVSLAAGESMSDFLEAGIVEGNGTALFASTDLIVGANGSYSIQYQGTVAGHQVRAEKICFPAFNSDGIIAITTILPAKANNNFETKFAAGEALAASMLIEGRERLSSMHQNQK